LPAAGKPRPDPASALPQGNSWDDPAERSSINPLFARKDGFAMAHESMFHDVRIRSGEIEVRKIGTRDLWQSLKEGYHDFNARPSFGVLFLILIYPLFAVLLTLFLQGANLLYLVFPTVAGLALLGPVVSVALFEMSRLRERGLGATWRESFDFVHSASFAPILALSIVMMLLYVAWLSMAQFLYTGLFGADPPASLAEFGDRLISTRPGIALILYGNVLGVIFAFAALAISVVGFPLLLDKPVSTLTAIGTSMRAVASNLYVMLLWGVIVAVLLIAGSMIFLVGLAAVLPILGHATWHLYRKLVEQ
jgi:uncharacterized membrane protein